MTMLRQEPVPDALLTLRHVSVNIRSEDGERKVLQDISFDLHKGEILGLVGESGSGKSLCAQAIMGLLPKPAAQMTMGKVFLNSQRIDNDPAALQAIRGKRIAMIFQEPMAALNPVQTVAEQIAEVFTLHAPALTTTEIRSRSIALLGQVGISEPEQRLRAYPHQLSGGLCQRVMIAMALAGQPDVLIADEPSTALDVTTQQQLLQLLQQLQQQHGMAVIFITHDLALVANWCQRVAVLQHGRLCEIAPIEQLFRAPQHPYTRQLIVAIHDHPTGSTIAKDCPLLLEARHLHKAFEPPRALFARRRPAHEVLRDVSLTVGDGEIVALVGESGCGKSTLGRALLLLDPPDSGEIVYRGSALDLRDKGLLRKLRRELQVIFQDTNESLNPRHTIGRILSEPFEIHGIGTANDREQRVRELLRKVELPEDSLNRFPHEFSGGQRQRIGIARAIALNPKLIVSDEAVSALDVATQEQIIRLLLKLKAELQLSLLFITHDLHVVRRIADRVLVMQQGQIVESGRTYEVFQSPRHEATQALLAASPHVPAHLLEPTSAA
jgi:peptide/nickel transport system ATP-binding protein